MRVKEARSVETVALWGIMAVATVLDYIRPFTNPSDQILVAATMVVSFGLVFPYIYDKFGLMKGEQRERIRRKEAFIGERMVLTHVGMAHMLAEALDADADAVIETYRDYVAENKDGFTVEEFVDDRGDTTG